MCVYEPGLFRSRSFFAGEVIKGESMCENLNMSVHAYHSTVSNVHILYVRLCVCVLGG